MVSTKVTKEIIEKTILPAAEKLIKGGKTTQAEKLLQVPKKKVKIGEKEVFAVDDKKTVTEVKIGKKDYH